MKQLQAPANERSGCSCRLSTAPPTSSLPFTMSSDPPCMPPIEVLSLLLGSNGAPLGLAQTANKLLPRSMIGNATRCLSSSG